MKDVRITHEDGGSFLTISIEGGETDQYNQGDSKRLEEVGGDLRPLSSVARYLHLIEWDPMSNQSLFGEDIRGD